jgi:hypothetical protein
MFLWGDDGRTRHFLYTGCCACLIVPPFSKRVMMPVHRKAGQQVVRGTPACRRAGDAGVTLGRDQGAVGQDLMMSVIVNLDLSGVPETLHIPLCARVN